MKIYRHSIFATDNTSIYSERLDIVYSNSDCGCDIYTSGGDCKYVDDGGCGCDD